MRTVIEGGWVVDLQSRRHVAFRDGAVTYEDDRIICVGTQFVGPARQNY